MGTVSFEVPGPGTYQVQCDPSLSPLVNPAATGDVLVGKRFYNDQSQAVTGTLVPGADTSDATATAGDILAPKTAYVAAGKVTGTIATKGASDVTADGPTVAVPPGYYPQAVNKTVSDPDLIPGNIKAGVDIFGVTGSLTSSFSAVLVVTVDAGAEVTATDGTTTLTATSTGTATFHLPNGGTWTVSATLNGSQATPATVEVQENFSVALSAGATQIVNIPTQYEAELSFAPASNVIGVMWNSADPSTAMTRLTTESDPNALIDTDITIEPVPAVGTGGGSSPFDNYLPWNGMEEYNIIENVVSYKRGDVGFSRTAYDTMVYIPEFWYKVIVNGANQYFYISNAEKDGFEKHPGSGKYVARYNAGVSYVSKSGLPPLANITRAAARTGSAAKGANWSQLDFASWGAYEYLFRIEFADWNSQEKVGMGYVLNNGSAINTGETDSMVYHTGRAAGENGKTAVQYRHIENPWGNVFDYIDGINFNNRTAYICLDHTKFADDTTTNYTAAGVTLPSSGYIKGLGTSNAFPWAFLPNTSGGSTSTYIPDCVYGKTGWRVLMVGAYWYDHNAAGLWYFSASYSATDSSTARGARILYHP